MSNYSFNCDTDKYFSSILVGSQLHSSSVSRKHKLASQTAAGQMNAPEVPIKVPSFKYCCDVF